MVKYVYRLLLFVFLLIGGSNTYAAIAPANATIGTQASLTFTDPTNQEQTILSNIVVITVNPVHVVTISPGITSSGAPGQNIAFPVKITNSGNVPDQYSVYTANDDPLENLLFTIDANENGVIDAGETTTIAPNGLTPTVQPGDSISLVATGKIPSNVAIGTTQRYIVHARVPGDGDIVIWNTNTFTITGLAEVTVTKNIGETAVPGAFVYVFKISNTGNIGATDLTIDDHLPTTVSPDDTVGRWFPFGSSAGKNIPITDTGYEVISDDVALSVINNRLVFKVKNVPAGAGATGTNGGILHLRVKPNADVTGGTTITNVADYTYNNGSVLTPIIKTNTAEYTTPLRTLTISNGISSSAAPGEAVAFPVIISNTGNTNEQYSVYTANDDGLQNLMFTVDANKNGVIDTGETTTIAPNGLTPSVAPSENIALVVTGNIPSSATPGSTQTYDVHARIPNTDIVKWNVNSFLITGVADISVVKSIGTTSTPGAFVYVFEIKNPSTTPGANLVLTDNLPAGIVPDDTVGRWFPFGDSNGKNIPLTDTGYETISDDVALSVINNQLVFKVKNIPAGAGGAGTNGGILHLRVKPAPGTAGGTNVSNTASYIYNNGEGFTQPKNTNTVTQPIPQIANVTVEKIVGNSADPGIFVYLFKLKNESDVAAHTFTMIDDFSSNIEPVGTTARWFPIGQFGQKDITLANDGYETVSDEVDLSVTSTRITFKIKNIAANAGANGGVLQVRFKAKNGTSAGTVIENKASYTYNNGQFMTSPVNTNTTTYVVPGGSFDVEITPDVNLTLARGEEFNIAQTVRNIGNSTDSYNLSLTNAGHIENPVFYFDDNGDGIRQPNENTPVTQTGGLGSNGTFKFFLSGRWGANAPSTNTFRIYATSRSNSNVNDWSAVNVSSYNSGVAVILTSDLTLPAAAGQTVLIPQTLENRTGAPDTFDLSVEEAHGLFSSVKFILDDNGDGVRQSSENTEMTTTPAIANNSSLKFFALVTLNNNVTLGNQKFRIFARANTFVAGSDWSEITLQVSVNTANVNVTKSIGNTGVPHAFVYVFDITNTGSATGRNIVLTDNLPAGIVPDISTGVWFASQTANGVSVTNAADGVEANAGWVEYSVVNGVLTLKLQEIAVGNKATLHLRVKPTPTTPTGTVVTNTASFTYNNGQTTIPPMNTNTVTHTTSAPNADVTVTKGFGETGVPGAFIYSFKITNASATAGFDLTLTDNLPTNIMPDISTGHWVPFGWETGKNIPLTDTGYEVISDDVALSIVNGVLTFKVKSVPANFSSSDKGGILYVRFRPVAGTPGGTVITNTASYTYNNSSGLVPSIDTNTLTYTVPTSYDVELTPDVNRTIARGEQFYIAQTVKNIGDIKDTYNLTLENAGNVDNPVFYKDMNNDGILQLNEKTPITSTSELNPNDTFKFFLGGRWSATAPSNNTFKIVATSVTDTQSTDFSSINVSTFSGGVSVDLAPDLNITGSHGQTIVMPQTIANQTGNADTFKLSIEEANGIFSLVEFYVDDNGDGVRQANETTKINNNLTSSVANGAEFKFFAVATLNNSASGTENFRIFARATNFPTGVDWSAITLQIVSATANVDVEKSIGETGVPNAFVYVFKITNDSSVGGTDLTITDTLPSTVTPDISTGVWFPFGQTNGKSVPLTDTGYETISDDIALSVVNNVLTLKVKNVPAGAGMAGTNGGILHLRVRPTSTTPAGTDVTNTASFTYNNGTAVVPAQNTNTVTHTTTGPNADVTVTKGFGETSNPGAFIYSFKITNATATSGYDLTLTDNLPANIVPDMTTGHWVPFGWETGKNIPLTDTGYEVISDDVALSIVNGVLTFKVKSVPGNFSADDNGGILYVRFRPIAGTAAGTVITNTASYTYNNGSGLLPAVDTNTLTYTVPSNYDVELTPDVNKTIARGELFTVLQTVKNIGDIKDTYNLTLENADHVDNPVFYRDMNNDGILQLSEKTPITSTTEINPNGTFNFFLSGRWGANAPSNNTFKIVATSVTDAQSTDFSSIVVSSFNGNVSVMLVNDLNLAATLGQSVLIPQTLTNKTGNADTFKLTLEEGNGIFSSVKFYADINNDGVRQVSENTPITETPSIPNNGTYMFFAVAELNNTATTGTTETFRIFARANNFATGVDWSIINLQIIAEAANVNVVKSIGETGVPGAFVYVFKITNDSNIIATDLTLTDTLANTITPDITTGVWFPFGHTSGKSVPLTDTGYETISDDIALSVVNNVLTLKVKNVPAGAGMAGTNGGVLHLRVKPVDGTPGGTTVTNTASFTYNNGSIVTSSENTNTVTYTTPSAMLTLEKYQAVDTNGDNTTDTPFSKNALTANPGYTIFYKLIAENTGNANATNLVIRDTTAEHTTIFYGDGSNTDKGKPVWRIDDGPFNEITSKPALGATGEISASIPVLAPGQKAIMYYNVKVNN